MPSIPLDNGKPVLRDGKIGIEQACCCVGQCDCASPGTTPAVAGDASKGLVWLSISSCIGTGAAGTVDAPRAASPCDYEGLGGAITGATVTSGGSGYARLGRVAPTVTASVAGGTGATLSVTLQQGTESLCELSIPYWSVASVSVTSGGSGYAEGAAVTFTATSGTTVTSAAGTARVVYDEPQNAVLTILTAGGSGAVLEPVWELLPENEWPAPHKKTYRLASVTVVNGGSGYADLDQIELSFASAADGTVVEYVYIDADYVGAGGEIEQVYVGDDGTGGGEIVGSPTDALHSVVVTGFPSYGGKYYLESASVDPYVPAVAVGVQQQAPSTGSGAVIAATVEDDTSSPDFGKIVGLEVVDGGSGYLNVPLACELPDKLYMSWGGKSSEYAIVPVAPNAFAPFLFDLTRWGNVPEGFGSLVPATGPQDYSFDAVVGLCKSGDCCIDQSSAAATLAEAEASEMADFLWKSFSVSSGHVLRPGHYGFSLGDDDPGASALACQCDDYLHLELMLLTTCSQYIPARLGGSYRISIRVINTQYRTYCLRFERDEDGCPVGDAVIVSTSVFDTNPSRTCDPVTDWYGDSITDCTCDEGCFEDLFPVVSFMPP